MKPAPNLNDTHTSKGTTMTITTTAPSTTSAADTAPAIRRLRPLLRTDVGSGLVAAAVTTAIAAIAQAADVPLAVDSGTIPLFAFAQVTLMAALVGTAIVAVLARTARQHRLRVALIALIGLTAISLVPIGIVDATTATRLVLTATHVVAAAIIVPQLNKHLRTPIT